MRLTSNQIEYLAFRVVKRLQESGLLEAAAREDVERKVASVITDDLAVEDKLNEEVRQILTQYEGDMRREGVQYHELFKIVKAKLVKERRLIL